MSVILITGCSTGIGLETALLLGSKGHTVYAGCRNPAGANELIDRIDNSEGNITPIAIDLLDQASIDACYATIMEREGRLDVLVSNAGIGSGRAMEETPVEEVKEIYETNVFGALAVLKGAIPIMRKQGSGRLVNVTSLAAINVFGGHGTYSSSKAAMEAICTALSLELAPFNIHVSLIEPGCVITPMWAKGEGPAEDSPYGAAYERLGKFFEAGLARAITAAECAEAVEEAINADEPQFRYGVGPDATDYEKAYKAVGDDEEWQRIGRLDNATYAAKWKELTGEDTYL